MTKPLTGWQQLQVPAQAAQLLPLLLQQGLNWEEAWSLACNTTSVYFALKDPPDSPLQVLKHYSLEEILHLAEHLSHSQGGEWGYNPNFQEVDE